MLQSEFKPTTSWSQVWCSTGVPQPLPSYGIVTMAGLLVSFIPFNQSPQWWQGQVLGEVSSGGKQEKLGLKVLRCYKAVYSSKIQSHNNQEGVGGIDQGRNWPFSPRRPKYRLSHKISDKSIVFLKWSVQKCCLDGELGSNQQKISSTS